MQVRSKWFMLPLAAAVIVGCGDDTLGPGDIELSDLVGTWNVTQAQYVADANSGTKYDKIKDQNATGTAVVRQDGRFVITYSAGGLSGADSGQIQVNDSGLLFNYFNQPTQPVTNVQLKGDKLSMTIESLTFDFPNDDQDNTPVAANVNYVWDKTSD